MKRFALTVTVLFFATVANAQIYQWKDESGKTFYSDKPPVGNAHQQQKIDADSPAYNSSPQKTAADRELEFRKRQKESQETAEKTKKEQAAASDMKENCESARRHLQLLESGERVALRDDKGERYYMEDSQREQEIAKARQAAQSTCK